MTKIATQAVAALSAYAGKRYTERTNAVRAAKKAGLTPENVFQIAERAWGFAATYKAATVTVGDKLAGGMPVEEAAAVARAARPQLVVSNPPKASTTDMAKLAAVMPAPKTVPTPYEIQQARKAKRVKTGGRSGATLGADAKCLELLQRKGGATIAEIREATGWKGVIKNGPERVAKRAGKVLHVSGKGEAAQLTLA